MTVHIGAKPGQIAQTVLMPGDPYRARWAAETFLDGAELVNEVRGMLGFTGTWNGHRVTIHGSGMGMPSLSIYANELIKDYGSKTLIRIGSCGGMAAHVGIRDVILAMTASSVSTPSRGIFRELNFAPTADWGLLHAAYGAAVGVNRFTETAESPLTAGDEAILVVDPAVDSAVRLTPASEEPRISTA